MQNKTEEYRQMHTVIQLIQTDICTPRCPLDYSGTYIGVVQTYGAYRCMGVHRHMGVYELGGCMDVLGHTNI